MMPGRIPNTPPSAQEGTSPGGGRLGVEIPVVGPIFVVEDRRLSLEAEDRAVDIGLARQHTGIVHQVTGGEVIGAIHNHVIVGKQLQCVVGLQGGVVNIHLTVGVDLQDAVLGRFHLRLAHPGGAVDHLPLQVGHIHHIKIDNADPPHAGCRQVQQQGRAKAACADAQHFARFQPLLSF
jgi:hypothetical protein